MTTQMANFVQNAEPRRFRLHAIGFGFALLAFAPPIVAVVRSASADAIGYKIGQALGRVLVALLLGWLAFRVARRSNLVGNLIFCTFVALSALGARATVSRADRAALHRLQENNRKDAKKHLAALDTEEGLTDSGVRTVRRQILKLEATVAATSGITKVIAGCGAEFMRTWEPPVADHDAAYNRFEALGAIDAAALRERADIQPRLLVVEKLRVANEVYRERIRNSQEVFESCLSDRRVSESDRHKAAAGFRQSFPIGQLLEIRDIERGIMSGATAYFTLLDKHWGKWSYDSATEAVLFDEDPVAEEYNAILEEIVELGEKEERLQRQMLQRAVNAARDSGG
jgi:hypothetical protein